MRKPRYSWIYAWIHHHPDALPRTLEELARWPVAFRRAILDTVPREARRDLWGAHLSGFLSPESGFSAEQRQVIEEIIARLPQLLGDEPTASEAERWAFVARVEATISEEERDRLFATIGPAEPPEGLPVPDVD